MFVYMCVNADVQRLQKRTSNPPELPVVVSCLFKVLKTKLPCESNVILTSELSIQPAKYTFLILDIKYENPGRTKIFKFLLEVKQALKIFL